MLALYVVLVLAWGAGDASVDGAVEISFEVNGRYISSRASASQIPTSGRQGMVAPDGTVGWVECTVPLVLKSSPGMRVRFGARRFPWRAQYRFCWSEHTAVAVREVHVILDEGRGIWAAVYRHVDVADGSLEIRALAPELGGVGGMLPESRALASEAGVVGNPREGSLGWAGGWLKFSGP